MRRISTIQYQRRNKVAIVVSGLLQNQRHGTIGITIQYNNNNAFTWCDDLKKNAFAARL